jgi:two-component system cell cycle response regulator DivK
MARQVILIVEDNEQNMELATFLLEEAGFSVRTALNVEEARERLAEEKPDLVLMDMNLAGADGLGLVAEIRKDAANRFAVVALTAHAMRGDKERFLAGGCDGYISKPINTHTFLGEVARFLPGGGGREDEP